MPLGHARPKSAAGVFTLSQLSKGSIFQLVEDFADEDVFLSAKGFYRVLATMSDSGRTFVIEHLDESRRSRISREHGKSIQVYRYRQA
jgi:hypothetical protein